MLVSQYDSWTDFYLKRFHGSKLSFRKGADVLLTKISVLNKLFITFTNCFIDLLFVELETGRIPIIKLLTVLAYSIHSVFSKIL